MSTCAIRYRLDGPGPAAFIVECDSSHYLYTRGSLGAALPEQSLTAMLAASAHRWVPATGVLILERRRPAIKNDLPLTVVPSHNRLGNATTDTGSYSDSGVAHV